MFPLIISPSIKFSCLDKVFDFILQSDAFLGIMVVSYYGTNNALVDIGVKGTYAVLGSVQR